MSIEKNKIEIRSEDELFDRYGMNKTIRFTYFNLKVNGATEEEKKLKVMKTVYKMDGDLVRYDPETGLLVFRVSSNSVYCRLNINIRIARFLVRTRRNWMERFESGFF